MKTQVIFWMLAAIDGHAKNFSIFHLPRGLYHLTPLYDVISAYPLVSAGQIDRQRLKMAMAVRGKNRHYHWDKIGYRHWLGNAKKCRFSPSDMEQIIGECCDLTPDVVEEVGNQVGDGFDEQAASIFKGLMTARDRLCKVAKK